MSLHDSETVDDVRPALAASKYYVHSAETLNYDFGAASHIGRVRAENQDHYIVLQRTRTQQLLLTNAPTDELKLPADSTYAMAVADGMGGCGQGGLASLIAIRTGWELAGRASSWLMKLEEMNSQELTERIEGFVYLMQQAFVHEFQENPAFGNSGTTFTSAYLVSGFASTAQIGDSPSFLWRDGTMRRLATDHTVEQDFISAGVAPEIAGKFGHMLTRCLGYESQNTRPETHFLRMQLGDQLLIATDGLTDMVPDTEIAACLDAPGGPQSKCDALIELALAAGGKDNVTAVIARARA